MIAAVVALATGLLAIGIVGRVLRRGTVLDVPNERSSHSAPVVRGGGIGVGLALGTGLLVVDGRLDGLPGLVVAAAGFGLIGLAEDLSRDRPVLVRLAAQVATAAVAAWVLLDGGSWSSATRLLLGAVVAGALVAAANVFNFMDGINGISAIQVIAISATFAALGRQADAWSFVVVSAVLAGATMAFLPYNLPTPRLFLGDTGSYLLGAACAGLVVVGARAGVSVAALVLPFAVYLADTTTVVVRRMARGDHWWQPHREHVYQRLVDAGWGHGPTALFVGGATALCGLAGLVGAALGGIAWLGSAVVVGGVVAGYLATAPAVEARGHGPDPLADAR